MEGKATRRLLKGEITYSAAQDQEINILQRLAYPEQRTQFFASLHQQQGWMQAIVAHHLGLSSVKACRIADMKQWLHGSFNVCVPVTVTNPARFRLAKGQTEKQFMLRLPLPYRVGESYCPGNGDEKVRCESGTYAWLQQNAPEIPIPELYGFALSTGETFTAIDYLPLWKRWTFKLRCRILSWFGRALPSRYLRHQPSHGIAKAGHFDIGYVLIDYIQETTGRMLSATWEEQSSNDCLRTNLFRSLSRILLSITHVKLPRIGSFVIDDDGYLQLANRPLSLELHELENEQIPTDIPRDFTYSTVESYILDMLRAHDNRVIHQPNAITDLEDYIGQTAALAAMRVTMSSFFDPALRRGPFILNFTDFNQSNIFVDEHWNITCLLDLEWICSQPIEMVQLPLWFTNKAIDRMAKEPDEYDKMRQEFVDILAMEEEEFLSKSSQRKHANDDQLRLSTVLNRGWIRGTFWYSLALGSPTGLFAIFYKQLQPRFLERCPKHDEFLATMPWYWRTDFIEVGMRKTKDKQDYDLRLRQAFEE
ncbi:predicted protein [Uncinocarpus reesii 1704]|uniref:Aminoglycoside phosphotransferase domain-containing protein n=1 Tax=Uncinocarpus reesii (strain UAMH 1704) TaxID=336963 RepID=C4JPF0_UNCRE|nr:uncharacterized protein UREG_04532 [Uncinocarpus reesii 1704]EEP79686.1 predicted protein [Uncinocarpus reesii 1704]